MHGRTQNRQINMLWQKESEGLEILAAWFELKSVLILSFYCLISCLICLFASSALFAITKFVLILLHSLFPMYSSQCVTFCLCLFQTFHHVLVVFFPSCHVRWVYNINKSIHSSILLNSYTFFYQPQFRVYNVGHH